MGYRVAVVGATGAVGREMLKTLAEREFPVGEAVGLAAPRAVGAEVSFGEKTVLKMRNIETFDFKGVDLVLFAAGQAIAATHAVRAAAAGCMVIDDSGRFRMEFDVPLVVPEVNPQALKRAAKRRIVASPTGPSIPLAVALKPLHDIARVKRVVASTYQAVSGAGKEGMDELFNQTKGSFVNDQPTVEHFPKPIAFNCIPQVDAVQEDGATREEWAMAVEIRKILDPDVLLVATCVRVPVFIGHGVSVLAEFHDAIGVEAAWEALREAPGIQLVDKREDGGYVTPLESVGEDAVFVSRMRADPTVPHGLAFWCVVDNLRKGSALNAVQIAEVLDQQGMIGGGGRWLESAHESGWRRRRGPGMLRALIATTRARAGLTMDGEASRRGYRPLVPPEVPDLLAMHRHGMEMVTAANRLALGWMQQAAAQHVALTRRTFEQMTETARRVAAADAPPEQAQVMLGMLADARDQGMQTAQEIAALMTRMQGEAVALLGQAMRPPQD